MSDAVANTPNNPPSSSVNGAASQATRWSQIERAAKGDNKARSSFCRSYLPLVRAFLIARWRDTPLHGEIDDAVQETFVEFFKADGPMMKAVADRGDFRSYMFGVVRNIARRAEKRANRRRQYGDATDSILAAVEGREEQASQLFDREWANTLMSDAADLMRTRAEIAGPGARLRVELLRLRFSEDLPIREIAIEWDISPESVHRSYARAREEFRLCIRQVVGSHAVRTEAELDQECQRLIDLLG